MEHDEAALAAWRRFAVQYEGVLTSSIEDGFIKSNRALLLVDAFVAYGKALKLDSDALDKVQLAVQEYMDLNPGEFIE